MPSKRVRRSRNNFKDGIYTTENGVKLRLKPVPAMLLESAQSMIPVPEIPKFLDENTGNMKENPMSPAYERAMEIYQSQRGAITIIAALSRGAVLLDENGEPADPPDDGWKEEIAFFGADWRHPEPKGYQSVTGVVELPEEWAEKCSYLMYVVMTAEDMSGILEALVGGEEYDAAVKSFQSD